MDEGPSPRVPRLVRYQEKQAVDLESFLEEVQKVCRKVGIEIR